MEIKIYTDGAAKGNPGSGGYGVVILVDNVVTYELSQGYKLTTNNRMEIMAALVGLGKVELLAENNPCSISVYSDSAYLVNAINNGWINSWKHLGWTKKGDDLKNVDLWKEMDQFLSKYPDIKFYKVKGHSGDLYNEKCDALAEKAAVGDNLIRDREYEREASHRKKKRRW